MTQVVDLPVSKLVMGENIRERTDEGLRASVEAHGILQPITVARIAGGRFEVLYGHRRTAAAKAIGLPTVPAIVVDRPADLPLRQLAENLDRRAVDPLDIATALRAHLDAHPGTTQQELARQVGRPQSWLNRKLALLELPEAVQVAVSAGHIGERRAIDSHLAGQAPNTLGRPRILAVDEETGTSRSVVLPLTGHRGGTATLGVDLTEGSIDLVIQDQAMRGLMLTLDAASARLLGRRLVQAAEAVSAAPAKEEIA